MTTINPNLEKAAKAVCRNPKHLPQIIGIFAKSLRKEELNSFSTEKLVEHWWENQLFLGISLTQKCKFGYPTFCKTERFGSPPFPLARRR